MPTQPAIIELHRDGRWTPAATLEALGDDRARIDYLPEYIFADDPWPVSLTLPVAFAAPRESDDAFAAPACLYDLVPQGRGRHYLVGLLGMGDHDALVLPLVLHGAFNPVGNLRIDQAVAFYQAQLARDPPPQTEGFTLSDLAARQDAVLDHLAAHAMLAGGTPGVQGVAPKYLLAEDADGRLYADLFLPDTDACNHWLLKGPRGAAPDDQRILRNEAAYLRVAAACGLRTHAIDTLRHEHDLLLLPRFDRRVDAQGVQRLHQESLASLAGLRGFGVPCRLNDLLRALRRHASNPAAETQEFIRRDVLNQAMRNTDNHARNHAVQRLPDGRVQLTPLFDFAPMYLDPELLPRALHWADSDGTRLQQWARILPALDLPDAEAQALSIDLCRFAETIDALPTTMREAGVDDAIIEACRPAIAEQTRQLAGLTNA